MGSLADVGEDVHDLNDVVRGEETFDSSGAQIGEGGFVEDGGVDEAAFGQVADDQLDEFVLVGGEEAAQEEPFECLRDGLPIHTRQGTHEEAEALAGFTGLADVFRGADTGFQEQVFECGEIVRGEALIFTDLADGGMVLVFAQERPDLVAKPLEVSGGRQCRGERFPFPPPSRPRNR